LHQTTGQTYPEPTVGALILNRRGEMLLVRSHKWKDRYTIAGGHVEVGETLVEALKREIKEEVGLDITDVRFLMVQEAILSKEFWEPRHFIFFDFVCQSAAGNPRPDGSEIQGCRWVKPRRALRMKLDSFTRNTVKRFLSETEARI
jgi:nucleoside triphosphatase